MSLDEEILECVDRGLSSLGESAKYVIYWHLKKDHKISREEIPRNPEKFLKALNDMFGDAGAAVLERSIIREIKLRFGDVEGDRLKEIVEELKRRFGDSSS